MKAVLATLCLACACARVVEVPDADGGVPAQPHIAEVAPAPGPIGGDARFHVAFSGAMDASLLLVDKDHSETVVLVAPGDVEVIAAAIAHGRLSAALRALLVPARASLDAQVQSLVLVPERPLAAGAVWLLVASRLKDAQGRKLEGNGARFGFTVAAPVVVPRLVQPAPGSIVPRNLARVHLDVPEGAQGRALVLSGPAGTLWQGLLPPQAGPLTVALCGDGADCAALTPGAAYSLQLDGSDVPDAGFTAGACRQEAPPQIESASPQLRDDSLSVEVTLAAPGLVRLDVAPAASASGSDDDGALALLCAKGACSSAQALTACVRDACAAAPDGGVAATDPCIAQVAVPGLSSGTGYLLRIVATDDEGHVTLSAATRATTLGALPSVVISEVMAWAPLPAPRSTGQYVELLNTGSAPCDIAPLALVGPDGKARALTTEAGPLLLGPGERALAVGASFDAARYPDLPSVLPLLRATTQRLLGRGLTEASPPAFSLVLLQDGADPVVLDAFPGGTSCAEGESLERDPQGPGFSCGASGGSPGRAP